MADLALTGPGLDAASSDNDLCVAYALNARLRAITASSHHAPAPPIISAMASPKEAVMPVHFDNGDDHHARDAEYSQFTVWPSGQGDGSNSESKSAPEGRLGTRCNRT